MRSFARLFPVLLAIALLPALLLARTEANLHALHTTKIEDTYSLPGPGALRFLSLGHREALASVLWTRALVYFGDQVVLRGPLRYLAAHVDAIVGLDPDFRAVYEWAAIVSVYNSRQVSRRSIEMSNHYLERGLGRFPSDGELLALLAFNYAVELPAFARDQGEKDAWKRRAAALFERAARLPGGGRASGLMAAELYTRTGQAKLAEAHLKHLYVLSNDPTLRAQAEARLQALTGEAAAEDALSEARGLFARWKVEYPYMPTDLYVLVGPRRLGAVADASADDAGADASADDAGADASADDAGDAGAEEAAAAAGVP